MFNCSDVNYVVLGTNNCGSCINTTINVTTSTCTNMSIDGHVCSLSIQTESETCEFLKETISDPILILLKGSLQYSASVILYIHGGVGIFIIETVTVVS